MYVVIGTDNFSYEDYPVSIHDTHMAAAADAANREIRHRADALPNTLHDTFWPYPMREAQSRLGMSRSDIIALVDVLQNDD